MLEVAGSDVKSFPIDHNDLIAAVCEDLNDNAPSHALDDLFGFGISRLFGHVVFGIALEYRLLGNLTHLYSASIPYISFTDTRSRSGNMRVREGWLWG